MAITAGLLAAAAAAQAAGNIYAGTQEFTRDDRDRLRQLERQEALGRLGMTPQERQQAQRQILQPLQTIEREAATQRAAQMAGQDLGQGAAYRQMLIEDQVRQQGRLAAQQMLQQQQEAAIARDQAEIAQLEAQRRRRRQIMATGAADAISTGAQLGAQEIARRDEMALQKDFLKQRQIEARDLAEAQRDIRLNYSYLIPPPNLLPLQ